MHPYALSFSCARSTVRSDVQAGVTPLMKACQGGRSAVIRYLVEECHVSVNMVDTNGNTACNYLPAGSDDRTYLEARMPAAVNAVGH